MRAWIRHACGAFRMIGQMSVFMMSSTLSCTVYILRAIRCPHYDITVQAVSVGMTRGCGFFSTISIALIGGSRCCKRSQHHAAHHGTDKSETDNKFCLFHLYPSSYCLVIFAKSVCSVHPATNALRILTLRKYNSLLSSSSLNYSRTAFLYADIPSKSPFNLQPSL